MFFKRHFNASQEDRALGEVGGGGGDEAETDPVPKSHFRRSLLSFPLGIPSAQEEFLVAS